MFATYKARELDLDSVSLPDYSTLEKPLVEVFTLYSSICPACGYMLSAAQQACKELDGQVDLIEYRITNPENVARMLKLGIRNLPSILINGELKFSSLIPSNRELVEEIRKHIWFDGTSPGGRLFRQRQDNSHHSSSASADCRWLACGDYNQWAG